jgi:steroid delta-isomerase-like uncharacterized protein
MSAAVIEAYYAAFNAGNWPAMLELCTDDVVHDVNQGGREVGREAFRVFLDRMEQSYKEELRDLAVMTDPSGARAAAEFVVHGTYVATDPGFIEARGQTYVLPAGAFFALRDGKIARVTTYYNLKHWLEQVGAP